ncbi:McrC family protein [Sphingosinicella sp. BN140058]|uniref:McrC family protein n=1 Tax=Sphingosinicella sp. BN140058 TaxID=1892855 RepID=UPI0010102F8C|nr:restriction endonuclease [Sphingosinicella sp. BN140058]QAY78687.1 restriction endonuclease [Sphingosinicella sp. BN140058]
MIRRTILEWQSIAYGDDDKTIPESVADRIAAAAAASPLAGRGGSGVIEHGRKALRARGVVGVIAAQGCALEILPKIEGLGEGEDEASRTSIRDRLIHMLGVAYDLDIASADLTALGLQNETLLEVLIARFAGMLADAVRRGMPRRYVPHEEDLPALRGRLDVVRQFTTLAASPQRLACRFDALSPDIALNQIMKAAVTRLSRVAVRADTQRTLAELAFAYADIASVAPRALRWDAVQLDRTNARWKQLVALARLLLGGQYQSSSGGASEGFSLLFEMNALFETYAARMLATLFAGTAYRVVAQGGRRFCLDELAGEEVIARRFQTKPDILVMKGQDIALLIDTKWKRLSARIDDPKQGVSQADVYQMMAYGRIYGCPKLMLLYPHHGGLGQAGESGRYRVTGCADELVTATLNMGLRQKDVSAELARLPTIVALLERAQVAA